MNDILRHQLQKISQTSVAAVTPPTPALFLHCAIFAANNNLLSDETFRLVSFEGQEGVSQPFEHQLELHGNTSPLHGKTLSFDDVIGRPVTVGIQYPSSYTREQMVDRFARAVRGAEAGPELALFNGIVTAFSMEVPGVYRLTMKPALWRLSLTNHYEIYRQKNIRDAIISVLERHRIPYSMDAVSGSDNPAVARIQDWLQAGETDLDFIQRLMSKAHLYYYFTHTGNSHRLVFVNRISYSYPPVFADKRQLRYTSTSADELGLARADVIAQYSFQRSLVPSGVNSVFTRQEAAWEADPVAQFQTFTASTRSGAGELPFRQYKIYQYGGSKEEVRHFNDATSEALETSSSRFSGSSYCAHFRVGHQFGVTGADQEKNHPSKVQPSLEGRNFVLTQVRHQASADGGYRNEFEATEASGFLAPFSLQETQQGAVLAKVVAHAGHKPPEDWRYYTDDYFDPETSLLSDANGVQKTLRAMGVYVRFSTEPESTDPEKNKGVWVKLSPSMQTVPEIGVTVLVGRAQDESELPEIQSIIQANGGMVIMPSTWTASTHVGSSYSTVYGDGQSIRFGRTSKADLTHAVEIVRGTYDTHRYRETGYGQGASYSFSCSESNAKRTRDDDQLFGPYKSQGEGDLLSASESFGSSYTRHHGKVSSSYADIGISYNKSIIGQNVTYTTFTGTVYSETKHEGDITSKTTINANSVSTTTHTGNSTNTSITKGNSTSTSVSTGDNTSTSTVNGSSTSTSTYNGSVTSTNNHHGEVTSNTHHYDNVTSTNKVDGIARSTNTNNIVINFGLTGAQTSSSATGVSNSNDAIGASNKNVAVGASLDVSVIGSITNMNLIGNTNTIELVGPGFTLSNRAPNPKLEMINLRLTMIDVLQIYL